MKRIFVLSSIFLFSNVSLISQTTESRILLIEQRLLKIDKAKLDSIRKSVEISMERFPTLISNFNRLNEASDYTSLFTKLNAAANPNNDSLFGKSYTSFIKDEARNILMVDLKGEARSGFSNILTKITTL